MSDVTVTLNFGQRELAMTFDVSSPVHQSILGELQHKGAYEPGTHRFLNRVLRPGDVFVDIGGHIGYFTMIASELVGDKGRVITVEPVDENFNRLENNVRANNLDNVEIVKSVISDKEGTVSFNLNKDNDGGHALWEPGRHPANEKTRAEPETLNLPSMTLASLFAKHQCSHARLIKIDTEGAEPLILQSGAELLKAGAVDFIIAEVNVTGLAILGDGIDGFFSLAQELGFVICLLNDDGTPPTLLMASNRPNPKSIYNVLLVRPEALSSLM